ncbi:GntR family transcriptional regulator [Streptomyces sp. YC504]|uniref:GntR family transcriptional regulator n=1 Tax=Streptomyces mesophilus TaxID=1775132 RepID=A0A6G4XCD7_9ACTN|nr:GntR family transcriptional regulator [Streptomyces mesophilus]NGO75209.1 GntR family transcriptional regulator [Streptomyces mesophilus]
MLWDAAHARLAEGGTRLTLTRVHRETGVPIATLSDWRRGNHAPRETDDLLKVVRLLTQWAQLPPPDERDWMRLVDQARGLGTGRPRGDGASSWAPSSVGLGDGLMAGFTQPLVELDAVCLTGQALSLAMGRPVLEIHAGKVQPARIDVRVMMPSSEIQLAYPLLVEGPADGQSRLHEDWLGRRNSHARALRSALLSLRASHGIDAKVSFRTLPFTPMAELYLINSIQALFGYCTLVRRGMELDHEYIELYDAAPELGMQRRFGTQREGDGEIGFVEQSHLWFNSVWETIAGEMMF